MLLRASKAAGRRGPVRAQRSVRLTKACDRGVAGSDGVPIWAATLTLECVHAPASSSPLLGP